MSSELLKELESAAKRTSDEVAKMETCGILPIFVKMGETVTETITASSLKSMLSQILESALTIAVCGVVKAGKSTFLNSIIFGSDVLPTFPTPCTAKLTFITHTDGEQYCEASFFTEEEFKRMKSELAGDSFEMLEREMEFARSHGVSPAQWWGRTDRVEFSSPAELTERLRDYASADGCFTPFVKEIKLAINRPELKGLFIVDTPGLDDPNPLNSRVTEQWANKAHAVVYLMPWRGMSANDRAFVERNYGTLSEDKGNRVFVITRIDENRDWLSTKDVFIREFPSERGNVCGYSAKTDLLLKAEANGATLSEDDAWRLGKLRKENFNPDPSNVRALVAHRLFEGGGQNGAKFKIEQLNQQIKRCYEIFIAQTKEMIGQLEEDVKIVESDREKAQRDVERLQNLRMELQRNGEDIVTRAKNSFANGDSAKAALAADMRDKMKQKTARVLDKHLGRCNSDSEILPAIHRAKGEIETLISGEMRRFFEAKIQDAEDALHTVKREIKNEATAGKCEELVREPDATPLSDKGKALLEAIAIVVDFSSIDDSIHWYRSTNANKLDAMAAFEEVAAKTVDEMYKRANEYEHFCRGIITGYVSETLKKVEHGIDLRQQKLSSPEECERILKVKKGELEDVRKKLRAGENAYAAFG